MPDTRTAGAPTALFQAAGDTVFIPAARKPQTVPVQTGRADVTARTRTAGQRLVDEMGTARAAQTTVAGRQVVDALVQVARRIGGCGCGCCSATATAISTAMDLEEGL
jgi:hypothetical protein